MNLTFNLRKMDRQTKKPDLLKAPRPWMEEVCGSLDLINRADVRIGMDFLEEEDMRVLNGVRRGENFDPIVIKPVGEPGHLSGFTLCTPVETDLLEALSLKQKQYWETLPDTFQVDDVRDTLVPHSALYRLLDKAKSLGLIEKAGHTWKKNSGTEIKYVDLSKLFK